MTTTDSILFLHIYGWMFFVFGLMFMYASSPPQRRGGEGTAKLALRGLALVLVGAGLLVLAEVMKP